jgi:RNA polymerase sigma factor (sigma-70 family)
MQPFGAFGSQEAVSLVDGVAIAGVVSVENSSAWSSSVLELYCAHWDRLVRLAALLLDDVAASEDVVQEAFIRLDLNRRARSLPLDSEVAFVTRIVVNLARSSLRRRLLGERVVARLSDSTDGRYPDGMGADSAALALFERQAVVAVLRRLPRRQREAVVLRYYGDLSLEEMSRAMGVRVGTAKSNLTRGRDALARWLAGTTGEEGRP